MHVYVATDHHDEQAAFSTIEGAKGWIDSVSGGPFEWEDDGPRHWVTIDGFVCIEKLEVDCA